MNWPKKCVVDTNVPETANLAHKPDPNSDVPLLCVLKCIEAIERVIKKKSLVIDAKDEIFDEYMNNLSLKGQPGIGDLFMKWVHDQRWTLHASQRVEITKKDDSYEEFPLHDKLTNFDPSDRKFVAVANACTHKPEILQATDSKWWGWKEALAESGVTIRFLCPQYIERKYTEKMRS